MSRILTPLADERAQGNLNALLHSNNDHKAYQQAMTEIGNDLGRVIKDELTSIESTYLAFTVEELNRNRF